MPSPFVLPAASRPVRSAGVLGLLVLMALALLLAQPAQSSAAPTADPATPALAPGTPVAPADPSGSEEDSPVRFDLLNVGPTALRPGATLTAEVEVTNTSAKPIPAALLDLRTRTPRVTDRAALDTWEKDTTPHEFGATIASQELGGPLAPGDSIVLRFAVASEDLGYSEDPSFWGTRRIAFTLRTPDQRELATLRTFVVWWPPGVTDSIDQSVLLPISADDPGQAALNPSAYGESAESGRLAGLSALAERQDVDWLLDPAVVDPPALRYRKTAAGGSGASDDGGKSSSPPSDADVAYAPEDRAEDLATTLAENTEDRTVLTLPYARADLPSLRKAKAKDLRSALEDRSEAALSDREIDTSGLAVRVPAESASPAQVAAARATDPDLLIIPTASLMQDPSSTVTPSGAAALAPAKGSKQDPIPVLAPDSALSAEFSGLSADSDAERTRQRMLAETAVIAEEPTDHRRQVLISPDPSTTVDAEAADGVLSAFSTAPWLQQARTEQLIETAKKQEWSTSNRRGDTSIYSVGQVRAADVSPSAPSKDGGWEHTDTAEAPARIDGSVLRRLGSLSDRLQSLESATTDDSVLDATRLTILSGASESVGGGDGGPQQRATLAEKQLDADYDKVTVQTASSYNLVADSAGVPVTINNELDTAIVVHPLLDVDSDIVRLEETHQVRVPAHTSREVTVPVEAVANGKVTLTAGIAAPDGTRMTKPHTTTLSVNPAWENWTTLVLVIAMGLLVVVGVLRARKVGSDRRAPAEKPGSKE